MSAQSEVPVYYLDQDESFDSPCFVLSRTEARQHKKEGRGWFICHGRKFRLCQSAPVQSYEIEAGRIATASTITFSEALANVGITGGSERDPVGKVRRAREKIRVYPFVSDDQAVLGRCRWHAPQIAISAGV